MRKNANRLPVLVALCCAMSVCVSAAEGQELKIDIKDAVLISLENNYKTLSSSGFNTVLPLWLARSSMINRQISVSEHGSVISGVVRGLSPEGGLFLDSPQGAKTLFAGDVTILGIDAPAA